MGMAIPSRFYQISLRTLFEATFVVAVILGFLYWRSRPTDKPLPRPPGPGRYQLHVDSNDIERQYLFDSHTGRTWVRSKHSGTWYERGSPPKSLGTAKGQ
jgi:hypothetical protein